MKICSYCGRQYNDDAQVCAVDQQPLKSQIEPKLKTVKSGTNCPQCGALDDYSLVPEFRRSFSVPIFLAGGLIAVLFRNGGRSKRVKCNQCQARFYVSSRLNRISKVIFWLLISLALIPLFIGLLEWVRSFRSP